MKILWILLAVQTSSFVSASVSDKVTAKKCCNSESNLINDNKCIPDTSGKSLPIALKCESKYVLDPNLYEDDKYNVTANGSLNVFDFASAIPPGE